MKENLEVKLSEAGKLNCSDHHNYRKDYGIRNALTKLQKVIFYSISMFGVGSSSIEGNISAVGSRNENDATKQIYFLDDEKEVLKKYAFWSDSSCDKPDEQSICMECKCCKGCRGCRSCKSCGLGPIYGAPTTNGWES